MPYILPNKIGITDTQGNTLLNKGRVKYNSIFDDVGNTYTNFTVPELYKIAEDNFVVNPWFDGSGNPIPFDTTLEFFDYEDAHVFFRKDNGDDTYEYIVYKEPQSGQNLEDIKDYINFNEPSLDFSDEGNSQYITLL